MTVADSVRLIFLTTLGSLLLKTYATYVKVSFQVYLCYYDVLSNKLLCIHFFQSLRNLKTVEGFEIMTTDNINLLVVTIMYSQ